MGNRGRRIREFEKMLNAANGFLMTTMRTGPFVGREEVFCLAYEKKGLVE